ncbi:hypothetical protein L1887_25794 [Cichorium endivia]|nr:hypothetical protein L1887_25794 [Cichorium endivia]
MRRSIREFVFWGFLVCLEEKGYFSSHQSCLLLLIAPSHRTISNRAGPSTGPLGRRPRASILGGQKSKLRYYVFVSSVICGSRIPSE